jgi:hypothetical protein
MGWVRFRGGNHDSTKAQPSRLAESYRSSFPSEGKNACFNRSLYLSCCSTGTYSTLRKNRLESQLNFRIRGYS